MSRPPVVTMGGLYGTGISTIGPRAAERLGVPLLDRAIVAGVAERLQMPESAVESYDPDTDKAPPSGLHRFLDNIGEPATADTGPTPDLEARRLRSAIADYLAEATVHGGVVIGRGGVVILRRLPGVLHVRLVGSRDARVEQIMRMFSMNRATAERRRRVNDRVRIGYGEVWGVDLNDPTLYHLTLDSTTLSEDTCVDLIVTAARAQQSADGAVSKAD